MVTNPGISIGGEVFSTTPSVEVIDALGFRAYFFIGSAYVSLISPTNVFEVMYSGQGCNIANYCGTEIVGSNFVSDFVNGVASFKVNQLLFYYLNSLILFYS